MKNSLTGRSKPVPDSTALDGRSIYLRRKILKMLDCARRGHLASALSLVEILRVLYDDVLKCDPSRPNWPRRDRCILSKGHGCMALYAVLADKGFFPEEEFCRFCGVDGILGGHPEQCKVPGVEASTGSLGHGVSIGIGFALNARYERAGYHTFVIVGDGECNEGSVWEAAMCAAKHRLSNLTVVVDYNKQQSYGPTSEVLELEPFADKWRSFGFAAAEVDGHDVERLGQVLGGVPLDPGKPTAVICHTVKGKGIKSIEGDLRWHHKSGLKGEDIQSLYEEIGRD
jgi:transketolase